MLPKNPPTQDTGPQTRNVRKPNIVAGCGTEAEDGDVSQVVQLKVVVVELWLARAEGVFAREC